MFISELHVKGYKRLLDVKVSLSDLTVLIGPNACGKSSVLEVLDLLGRSAEDRLGDRLSALGGIDGTISRGANRRHVGMRIEAPLPNLDTVFEYLLALRPAGAGAYTLYGRFGASVPSHTDGPDDDWYLSPRFGDGPPVSETGLARDVTIAKPAPHIAAGLPKTRLFGGVPTGYRSPVRVSQQVRPSTLPDPDGDFLLAALQTKRSRDPEMFDFLQDALRAAYPDFEGLDLEPVAAGQVVLTWRERGQKYYGNELSDGALRLLFLATVLCTSDPPPLIMIDEPEVSLHPELLRILVDLMREAAGNGQVLVATQSPTLVSFLEPGELVVMDLDEEGWATARPAADMDLGAWLEEYTLGRLWLRGVLGGRP